MFCLVLTLNLLYTPVDTIALLPFVPAQHHIMSLTEGDINSDGLNDFILVTGNDEAKQPRLDTSALVRSFIVVLRQKNGHLQQVNRNDQAILCRECGGAFGDPFSGIE